MCVFSNSTAFENTMNHGFKTKNNSPFFKSARKGRIKKMKHQSGFKNFFYKKVRKIRHL